jgi:hypothetical protein
VLWRALGLGLFVWRGGLLHFSVNRISKCWKRGTGIEGECALRHRHSRSFMRIVGNLVCLQNIYLGSRNCCPIRYSLLASSKWRTGRRRRSRSARSESTPPALHADLMLDLPTSILSRTTQDLLSLDALVLFIRSWDATVYYFSGLHTRCSFNLRIAVFPPRQLVRTDITPLPARLSGGMRRPSLLKSKTTNTRQAQVVEFALDPAVTVESGTDEDQSDDPPEGGYGWVVCGAVALINGFTWGVAAVRSLA